MNQTIPSQAQRINATALRDLVWAIMQGPKDYYQLAEITGLSKTTVRRWLAPWRQDENGMPKLVAITAWHEDARGYPTRPAFEFKPGAPDVQANVTEEGRRKRRQRGREHMRKMIHMTAGRL